MRYVYTLCGLLLISLTATAQFPAPYCEVTNSNNIEPITLVVFAGINRSTSNTLNGTPGLINYTGDTGTVGRAVSYPITIKGNTDGNFTTVVRAYIDWNQDGDFSDAGESNDLGSITNSDGNDAVQLDASIAVPVGAALGNTRMRIFKKYSSYPVDPCTNTWGQAQDFTLKVTPAPPPSSRISTTTGGLWSAASTWVGGTVPLSVDNVTIADGATVTIDISPTVNSLTIGQGVSGILNFNATTSNTLTVTSGLTTSAGSVFNPYNGTTGRAIYVGGDLVLNGAADFTKTSTAIVMNGTTAQAISGTGNLGTGSPLRLLAVSNTAGVTLSRPITITSTLNLVQGPLNNGTNLTLDNTVGGVSTTTCAIQRGVGSLANPILTGAGATVNLAYIVFTGTTNAAVIAGNEIPAGGVLNSLTINNPLGVTLNTNLSLASASPLTLTSGILTVNPANVVIATNAAYSGTSGTATSFINGRLGLTWGASATRTYPIGSAGQLRTVSTTLSVGSGVVAFGILPPTGGTPGTGMTAISATRRWYGEILSGTITSYESISIAYGNDDGLAVSSVADRRIAQSATANGAYNSVGPASGTASPLISTPGAYTSLGYFALGLSAGSLPIAWDGGAGTNNWGDANNWSNDALPTNNDDVILNSGNTVVLAGGTGTYTAKTLTLNTGASLTSNAANTLTIGAAGVNNSSFIMDGNLTMSNGTINVNGNMLIGTTASAAANLQMSGGLLSIDGNDGTSASGSVANNFPMFAVGYSTSGIEASSTGVTLNATGGTIRIVDPNYNSGSPVYSFTLSVNSGNTNTVNLDGLTLEFGDGTSGTPGQNQGFVFNTYDGGKRVRIGNLVCNTRSDLNGNRFVQSTGSSADGSDIAGQLTVNTNSELRVVNNRSDLAVGGNIINNGTITVTGLTNGRLFLGGKTTGGAPAITTPQAISGTGVFRNSLSVATANVTALVVDNAGGVTFPGNFSVSDNLTLTNGNVNMGSNTFTVGASSASPGTVSFNTGRIRGKLRRFISAATGVYNFPVGITTNTRNAAINFTAAPSAGGSLTAEWISSPGGFNGLPLNEGGIDIFRSSYDGYWSLIAADGLAGGTYTGTFTPNNIIGVNDYTKLVLLKRTNSSSPWTLQGTHVATTGSNGAPVLSRTGMSGFSEFGIGGDVSNPLPVTLVDFWGEKTGEANKLYWTTSTETNAKGFELERSADGIKFSSLAFVATKAEGGNSSSALHYEFADRKPLAGEGYYRLKLMDKDGQFAYSKIVVLGREVETVTISAAYPNPVTDFIRLKIGSPKAINATIVVTDLSGRLVMQQSARLVAGNNQTDLKVKQLAAGSYVIKAICADGCETAVLRFVKQ